MRSVRAGSEPRRGGGFTLDVAEFNRSDSDDVDQIRPHGAAQIRREINSEMARILARRDFRPTSP